MAPNALRWRSSTVTGDGKALSSYEEQRHREDMNGKGVDQRRGAMEWSSQDKQRICNVLSAKEMPYSAKELYRLELQWLGKAGRGRGKAENSSGTA